MINEQNQRILGTIYLIWGILDLVFLCLALIFFSRWLPLLADYDMDVMVVTEIAKVGIVMIILIKSLPSIITGYGLLNKKTWARPLALFMGCLALFFFPIGTAIGVYTIYLFATSSRVENNSGQPNEGLTQE